VTTFEPELYAPTEGPCAPWCTEADVRLCGLDSDEYPTEVVDFGIALASRVMWAASGRRYGLCQTTVRPCHPGNHQFGFHPYSGSPHIDANIEIHYWQNGTLCGCSLPELWLPGPIAGVEEIMYDGVVLPSSSYAVKTVGRGSRKVVVRLDTDAGGNPVHWWRGNDLTRDPTTDITPALPDEFAPAWQVTYWKGRAIPPEAVGVTAMLAEQFTKARCGGKCDERITAAVTRVARRGTTVNYEQKEAKEIVTAVGNPLAELWLKTVNPYGRTRRSRVIRADDSNPRRLWAWIETPKTTP
jgi:hypothetical protein